MTKHLTAKQVALFKEILSDAACLATISNTPEWQQIADRLRKLSKAYGLTTKQVAALEGISERRVQAKLKQRKHYPNAEYRMCECGRKAWFIPSSDVKIQAKLVRDKEGNVFQIAHEFFPAKRAKK